MYHVNQAAQAEIDIKKSRFIGMVLPVADRVSAMRELARIRGEHPSARHVCWVLLCATDSGMDDDGEPSGTAARPIYNVLAHRQLQNVLAVVVRYFGGIRLGAGGLIRAYTQATVAALDAAGQVPVVIKTRVLLSCGFASENRVRHWCAQHGIRIEDVAYGEEVLLRVSVVQAELETLRLALLDQLGAVVRIRILPESGTA
ncbi:IMPACT family protein [Craterilacuibacter sp.]|uniref:IMPACT family protein n=1 Tax=Craterilacuibacter sp. TaxID=2870909 RepID=UPI003F4051DE